MDLLTLLAIAVALAMDAFAVALVMGLTLDPLTGGHLFRLGLHFGLFQAFMPVIGWLAGLTLQRWIGAYDHWIAFALLVGVGGRMVYEAWREKEEGVPLPDLTRGLPLFMCCVATSIDALAMGLSLAFLGVSIWLPSLVIGLVTWGLTVAGLLLGRQVSVVWGKRVEVFGGLVLCGIGVKILVEHTLLKGGEYLW